MNCRAGCETIETQEHLVNCVGIHGSTVMNIDTSFVKGSNPETDTRNIYQLLERLTAVEVWMDKN